MRGDNLHLPTPKSIVDTGDRMMVMNAAPSWSEARVAMFTRLAEPGFYRVFIVQDGPAFEACVNAQS
jgi:hypothetical protein